MRWRIQALLLVTPICILIGEVAVVQAQEGMVDPTTGLVMTGNWELVRNNCISCHSAKLITQQRGSATQWLSMIRWMQAKQNLWEFEGATEKKIIAYLASNYPPRDTQRRAALARELMP